jgi:glycolate oxidase FAD binding subunit
MLLRDFGSSDVLAEKQSRKVWLEIRDIHPLGANQDRCVWKLSVIPSKSPETIAKLSSQLDVRYFLDWAGGLIWLDVPSSPDASAGIIRGSFEEGHATLMRGPRDVRSNVDVFQPQDPALAALRTRVKHSFDPNCVLNPGRMYKDS